LPELSDQDREANGNRLPGWLAPGAIGALAASLAMVTVVPPSAQSAIDDQQLVSSHVRSLQPGHLTDVQTTNQHIVKPWFNGKIDFAPPVPELGRQRLPAGRRTAGFDRWKDGRRDRLSSPAAHGEPVRLAGQGFGRAFVREGWVRRHRMEP
jgi:hypothetical protein